jgi:heat-inducible transcriptional repressor
MQLEMTERRRQLLKLLIQEYVATSAPVASEHLLRRHGLNVSSATIRNELATLEELGFLTHLHTSAGRIPTDAGYRFFVENLMEQPVLPIHEERTIRHQFAQVQTTLDQWLNLAGSVMARRAQNVSVVLPPRVSLARLRNVHLIAVHDTLALVVVVLHDGMVRQQTLVLDSVHSQADLTKVAHMVNELGHDASIVHIRERLEQLDASIDPLVRAVCELACSTMRQYEEALNSDVRADGLLEMLNHPEFAQTERIKHMLELVQTGNVLAPVLPQVTRSDGVQVIIGTEHQHPEMRDMSMVLARYGVDDEIVGVLGVVGPMRMPYARAIATVRAIAAVMSDLVGELHGEPRSERDDTKASADTHTSA